MLLESVGGSQSDECRNLYNVYKHQDVDRLLRGAMVAREQYSPRLSTILNARRYTCHTLPRQFKILFSFANSAVCLHDLNTFILNCNSQSSLLKSQGLLAEDLPAPTM